MIRVGMILPSVEAPTPALSDAVRRCPHCGKEYKSEKALREHCKNKHPDAIDPE